MALPKIIKDIDEKFPISGGTVIGDSLYIRDGRSSIISGTDTVSISTYINDKDPNNRRRLVLCNQNDETDISKSLYWVSTTDGNTVWYRLYGEHNKPSLSDINAPSLTGEGATGTWAIDISGNASSATKLSYPEVLRSNEEIDNFNGKSVFQVASWSDTSSPGVSNGLIINCGWGTTTYGAQIAIDDDPTYFMALRQRGTDGWNSWKRIPMGDGTGASGTWSITATKANQDGDGNTITSTYLPLNGGTMKGAICFPTSYNKTCISFRPNSDTYLANLSYDYGGTESLFLNLLNPSTSFKIITGKNLSTFTNGQIVNDTSIPAFMVKENYVYTCGAFRSDSGLSDTTGTMTIIAERSNEVNFDGSGAGTTIFFGYRAKNSKPIPSTFVFGNSTGTSAIKFTGYYDKGVRGYGLAKSSSSPSNTDMVWAW